MAYAIIQAGGKQFRVTEGDIVRVPTIDAEIGDSLALEALVRGDGGLVEVGAPVLAENPVSATVIAHGRGEKVIVFKKKRRKQYKKTHGHRQNYTAVRIGALSAAASGSGPSSTPAPENGALEASATSDEPEAQTESGADE